MSLVALLRSRGGLLLFSATACVAQGDLPGPPYDVVVLDRVSAESDEFALQRRRLTQIDDFGQLSGPGFRIRQAGVLNARAVHGDLISKGTFEGDTPPTLRYVVEDGVAVPRDYPTLAMFSAAYQFESVLAGLHAVTTPSVQAMLDAKGAVDVIFGPVMTLHGGGATASLRIAGNAFFFAPGWQFGLARSSDQEKAPLAADGRVIAHELGHSVFQAAFAGGVSEECDPARAADNARDPWFPGRLEIELAISGFNEGFSDWVSFAVTGGTDPLASIDIPDDPRLSEHVPERRLTEDNFRWSQIAQLDDDGSELRRCRGKYCIGTLFARSLLATYESAGNALDDSGARQAYSQNVVAALAGTLPRMLEGELPLPTLASSRCEEREEVSAEDMPIIAAFSTAFVHGMPAADQASLCRELQARFEAALPDSFEQECQP